MKSNKIVDHKDQVILTEESSNSASVSVNGLTSTGTFLQGLFLQYLHKTIITILCLRHLYEGIYTVVYLLWSLQLSLKMSLQEYILRRIYKTISTTVYLLSSLHVSLQSKFMQSSLLVSLRDDDLRSSLLASLRSGNLRSSLLRSKFVFASPLASLWKIFLRRLYEDILAVTPIHSKLEILLQNTWGFMIIPKQVKPETPKSWIPSHLSP